MMDSKVIAIIGIVATIAASAIGWLTGWVFWGGKIEQRVKRCEDTCAILINAVTLPECLERMEAIKSNNNLQFVHSAEQLIEIKKLLNEQNAAVLSLNKENDARLKELQRVSDDRFDKIVGLLKP